MNWDPLHELVALRDRARGPSAPDTTWVPSVDLLETGEAFLIVAEVPGLGPDDFSITASSSGLVLTGQRRSTLPAGERYLRMERGHGPFSRAFTFSEPITAAGVTATYERGLLSITVPKAVPASDRRIAIR